MQTLSDPAHREALVARIRKLTSAHTPLWGRMTVYQMVMHCILCDEMYLGRTSYPRTLPGRLFGPMALRNLLQDERPLGRNAPTHNAFRTSGEGDTEAAKEKWIRLIAAYGTMQQGIVHWFFGHMTVEQVRQFAWKHSDHHLRQFGC